MTYFSFIIAAIQLFSRDTSAMNFNEGLDLYLDLVVNVEKFFLTASLIVLAVIAIITAILWLGWRSSVFTSDSGLSCGCTLLIIAVFWPILEFVTWLIANGLADSVSTAGIVDPTKFWLLVVGLALLGWG